MFIALLLSAALASGFGTLIGFGGGVFVVPILVLFFSIPIHFAVGAVAVALFPAALISSFFNARDRLVDYKLAFWLELPTFVGAFAGAYLAAYLPVKKLEVIFAFFLMVMAWRLLNKKPTHSTLGQKQSFFRRLNRVGPQLKSHHGESHYQAGAINLLFLGGLSGSLAGLFGVGGGFMKTPIMTQVFRVPTQVAVATSLMMIVFTSLASGLSHHAMGHVQWSLGLPLILGFSFGAFTGQVIKRRLSVGRLDKLIAFGLGLAGLSLIVHGLFL